MIFRRGNRGLSVEVFGDKQVARKLNSMGLRASNAKPAFDAIGHKILAIQKEQFSSQGRRSSGGWRPLAPSTIKRKGHDVIFLDTGELMESWKYGDSLNIFRATDESINVGSRSEHGKWHQPDPQGRRVFELTNADRVDLVKDLQYFIVYGEVSP